MLVLTDVAVLTLLALRPALHWLCWIGDQLLNASGRGGHEASALSTQSQSTVSPERGRSPAGPPECGDSGLLILSVATQEAGSELGNSAGLSERGDSGRCGSGNPPLLRYHVRVCPLFCAIILHLKTSAVHVS